MKEDLSQTNAPPEESTVAETPAETVAKTPPIKKALQIAETVFTWLVVALAVFMMIFTIISVATFDRNDRSIFGYKAFIVQSDSMSATDFSAGDLIFVKEVDPAELVAGDIISYISTNTGSYGETVTHKIRELTTDADGNPGFVTYGTTTDTNDENIVTYAFVLGKYTGKIPGAGTFFAFLKTTPGYILCIFLPFLVLILIQGVHSVKLFRQYRKEQTDEMKEERKQLEEERARSQEMMAELMALKQQLGGENGGTADASKNEPAASDKEEP